MMQGKVTRADLHLHTTASDGALSPREMVRGAKDAGMQIIAICDHDTVDGLREAAAAGKEMGLCVVPGIELSCGSTGETHLLGYGISPEDEAIDAFLQGQRKAREARTLAMLAKLDAMGMPIAIQEARTPGTGFFGRMNIADAMVQRGYVSSAKEAFDRYLIPGKPAYVPRSKVPVSQGIHAVKQAGALAVLAHPGRSGLDTQTLWTLLPQWIAAGLDGIEAYHASHNAAQRTQYSRLAREKGLLVTGGSDCHGRSQGARIGDHLSDWPTISEDIRAFIQRVNTQI